MQADHSALHHDHKNAQARSDKGPNYINAVYETKIGCYNECSLLDAALIAPQVTAVVLHCIAALQQRRLLRLDGGQTLLLPPDAGFRVA